MISRSRFLFACALLVGAVGCDSNWGSSDPAHFFTRIAGRILDGQTQRPLSGVTVKICNYEATSSSDGDGHWFIELSPGIGSGTSVTVTFERSGYGSMATQIGIFPDTGVFEGALQNKQFIDVGTTSLRQGEPLTANVTRDGAPLAAATVVAVLDHLNFSEDGTAFCTDLNIVGTTNASGVATLPNLDPTRNYRVWVPHQDLNGDGTLDIFSGSSFVNISETGNVVAVNVETFDPDSFPSVTGSNLMRYNSFFDLPTGTVADDQPRTSASRGWADLNNRSVDREFVFFSEAVVTPNHSVQLVFRYPVDVFESNFRYRNNLVSFADPDYDDNLRIDATATALAGSGNTIYNFTPVTPLPVNEVVTLNLVARSRFDPSSSSNVTYNFYVPANLTTIPVGIDNYNGSRDGSGGSNTTYLRFNEAVEGFYKVLAFTIDTSVTTFEDPFEWSIQFTGDEQIINNQLAAPPTGSNVGQSGAVAGRHFTTRIRTPFSSFLSLNDSATQVNTVTIEISARNIAGETLDTVVTLPVE